jgi:hypothetical protein
LFLICAVQHSLYVDIASLVRRIYVGDLPYQRDLPCQRHHRLMDLDYEIFAP